MSVSDSDADNSSGNENSKTVLCVFVPGIKGSELFCTECDRISWPPAFLSESLTLLQRIIGKSTFGIDKLLTSNELNCLTFHKKKAVSVIRNISILNGLINKQVYGPFLDRLESSLTYLQAHYYGGHNFKIDLLEYAYDWTQSNIMNAYDLYRDVFLKEIRKDQNREFIIISHSMGGMLSRYLLEYLLYYDVPHLPGTKVEKERIKSAIRLFYGIGVPHYGCIRALHYLVDKDNDDYSVFCRRIQSLYDMIPFNDLDKQITPLKISEENAECVDTVYGLRRTRSDIFLKSTAVSSNGRIANERDIVIDPKYWETNDFDKNRMCSSEKYIGAITDLLKNRFPFLKDCGGKIRLGLEFHSSLNSNHKPVYCRYLFVNAVGVITPSLIDDTDKLLKTCKDGDGVVCSNVVVARKSGTIPKLGKLLVFARIARLIRSYISSNRVVDNLVSNDGASVWQRKKSNDSRPNIKRKVNNEDNVYFEKNYEDLFKNVHVTMLHSIDVFTAIKDVFLTSNSLCYKYNLWNYVCGTGGCGRADGIVVLQEYVREFKKFFVTVKNMNNGSSLVTLKKKYSEYSTCDSVKPSDDNSKCADIVCSNNDCVMYSVTKTKHANDTSSLIFRLETLGHGKSALSDAQSNKGLKVNVRVNARHDGSIVSNLQIILVGHYKIADCAETRIDLTSH